jgi:hypothetical protein
MIEDLTAEDVVNPRAAAGIHAVMAPMIECGKRPRLIRSPDARRWGLKVVVICNLEVPDQLELREIRQIKHEADP